MFKTLGIIAAVIGVPVALGFVVKVVFLTDAAQQATRAANVRSMPFFGPAGQTVSLNQELLERLGTPVNVGEVIIKETRGDMDQGAVTLEMVVSGPKMSGHAQVKVTKADAQAPWVSRGGDFFPLNGPPIHLPPR